MTGPLDPEGRGRRAAMFKRMAYLFCGAAIGAALAMLLTQKLRGQEPTPVVGAASARDARLRAALADTLRRTLERAVADSAFPGAYVVVGDRRGVLAEVAVGRLDWAPSPAVTAATIWDMASLTKVVATTSAVMRLVDRGQVALDAPVQRYLTDWTGEGRERVTVRHLLTHSSGLPSWRPLHKESTTPVEALRLVYLTAPDTAPGVRYVYSDLGAILLGRIVEHVSGERLDRHVAARVLAPLGMRDAGYRPPAAVRARVAPTEYDPWRQQQLRGVVHDENAHALGGVAGHAGLFASGRDLERFARTMLRGGELGGVRLAREAMVRAFTARQDSLLSHRALGWETATGQNSAGRLMSRRAFGHTGFTGTSMWVDPEHDVYVVLLTNRVNPTRQNLKIGRVRVAVADAALGLLGAAAPATPAPRP